MNRTPDALIARARQMRADGFTYKAIMVETGLSKKTIYRTCRDVPKPISRAGRKRKRWNADAASWGNTLDAEFDA